jgi:hypothetical protein
MRELLAKGGVVRRTSPGAANISSKKPSRAYDPFITGRRTDSIGGNPAIGVPIGGYALAATRSLPRLGVISAAPALATYGIV